MKSLNLEWVSDSIKNDYKNWNKGDTVLISAQTGTGKTHFIKNTLLDNLESHERLLFVCNRTNLKRQLKRDLLRKFKEEVPEKLNDLDEVTTIGNQVTITSYHAISRTILDEVYGINNTKSDFSSYDYIVFDECHFIFADGGFNNKTRFVYEKAIQQQYPHIVKIFISATMDEIRDPILRCVDKSKNEGFGINPTIHEYNTGEDYSYIKPNYFNKIDTIVNLIKNDDSKDKWLVFISDINRDGNKLLEELGEEKCSIIKSGTISDELNLIINNSQFNKKVLVCTKAMDNGINLNDPKLKNVVIMAWDKITFIQMLGRKRINIDEPEEVNLYIPTRYKNSFRSKLMNFETKKKEIDLHSENYNEFCRKYDNDLQDFNGLNDIFYKDPRSERIKVNSVGYKRLFEDIKFAKAMIEKFDLDKKFAFVKEQLSWLGLDDQNCEENMIDDVLVNDELESLEEYLESLLGKQLFNSEQQELKKFITNDFDEMIIKLQGRHKDREPGLKILNKLMVVCDIPYIIKSKKKQKRIDGKVKSLSYWIIEQL